MTSRQRIVQEWLDKAQGDFNVALMLLDANDPTVFDAICFHCQQCIEKLLKAILIQMNQRPPKSHNLTELSELIGTIKVDWECDEDSLELLEVYAVDLRYPGYSSSGREAVKAVETCTALRTKLLALLD